MGIIKTNRQREQRQDQDERKKKEDEDKGGQTKTRVEKSKYQPSDNFYTSATKQSSSFFPLKIYTDELWQQKVYT